MGSLLLIDGHAYAYRAFYAIRGLTSPQGGPTNAIFGFIKTLDKLRSWLHPTHIAVVWDGGLAVERTRLLPGYKAQRPPMPEDLAAQLDGIVEYLGASGVMSLCQDGIEADDWIAALATEAALHVNVVIASSDKDFMQLVSPRIGLVNPGDKAVRVWGRDEVLAKCGAEPEQVVDWLSLVGDTVDNISGVPGVGPKTAAELLMEFRTVDGIYRNLENVRSERVKSALRSAEGDVRRNQTLIRLHAEPPRQLSLESLEVGRSDPGRLKELYVGWGFKSLAASVVEPMQVQQVQFF